MINTRGHGWDVWVWTYPQYGLHIFYCACHRYHLSRSEYLMRQLLLFLTCYWKHGWQLPLWFFIRSLYYNFLNRFSYVHAFKHVNIIFKGNIFAIKSLHIRLLAPTIGRTIQQNLIYIRHCWRARCRLARCHWRIVINGLLYEFMPTLGCYG